MVQTVSNYGSIYSLIIAIDSMRVKSTDKCILVDQRRKCVIAHIILVDVLDDPTIDCG